MTQLTFSVMVPILSDYTCGNDDDGVMIVVSLLKTLLLLIGLCLTVPTPGEVYTGH